MGNWISLRADPKKSFHRAIFSSCICDASDEPFAVYAYKVKKVSAAAIHFAIHQNLKRRPHHSQIVVGPHKWIVDPFFDVTFAGPPDQFGKSVKRHLVRLALTHQHHGAARQQGLLDRGDIVFRHAGKHCRDRSQYSLLIGCCSAHWRDQNSGSYRDKKQNRARTGTELDGFHGFQILYRNTCSVLSHALSQNAESE